VLPGWVTEDRLSVQREAEPYRNLTPEERGALMAKACRAAMRLLAIRDDRARVLAHVDPVPQSTVAALDRLRKQALARGHG
jgi:hypothetical protein